MVGVCWRVGEGDDLEGTRLCDSAECDVSEFCRKFEVFISK